jgi:hypothetical protein
MDAFHSTTVRYDALVMRREESERDVILQGRFPAGSAVPPSNGAESVYSQGTRDTARRPAKETLVSDVYQQHT